MEIKAEDFVSGAFIDFKDPIPLAEFPIINTGHILGTDCKSSDTNFQLQLRDEIDNTLMSIVVLLTSNYDESNGRSYKLSISVNLVGGLGFRSKYNMSTLYNSTDESWIEIEGDGNSFHDLIHSGCQPLTDINEFLENRISIQKIVSWTVHGNLWDIIRHFTIHHYHSWDDIMKKSSTKWEVIGFKQSCHCLGNTLNPWGKAVFGFFNWMFPPPNPEYHSCNQCGELQRTGKFTFRVLSLNSTDVHFHFTNYLI